MVEGITKAVLAFLWERLPKMKILLRKPIETAELKRRTRIVFIDDEPADSLLKTIREAGWSVQQLTDIANINEETVRTADIVFMDYKGVGKALTPSQEGVGLMKHLRRNYPKKHIVFYSGFAGFIPGHEVIGLADSWIQKGADPFEYIDLIEQAARKIHG